jgi:hypothetical protein
MWNVDLQEAVFQDPTLVQELTGATRMAPVGMVHRLFSPPVRFERLIRCVESLIEKMGDEDRYGTLRTFCKMVLIMKCHQESSSPAFEATCQKASALFKITLYKTLARPISYGRFSCGQIPASDYLRAAQNEPLMDEMEELVSTQTVLDPAMAQMAWRQARDPNLPLSYDNYAVKVPGLHEMLLIPAPRQANLKQLYETAIRCKAATFITLCSTYEHARIAPFWLPACFERLELDGGWKLSLTRTEEVYRSPVVVSLPKETQQLLPDQDLHPKIIARYITADNGEEKREFLHLHYQTWLDNQGPPDLQALVELFRYLSQQKREGASIINCHYGIGRTAIAALIDGAWALIRKELQKGTAPRDIVINLPELFYQMRSFLPHLGGLDFHFGTAYRVLHSLITGQPLTRN